MSSEVPKPPASAQAQTGPPVPQPSQFAQRAVLAIGIGIAMLLLGLLLWYALWVLLVIFAGVLLAIFLRTLVIGAHLALRLPMGWSLLVVILAGAGVVALAWWLLFPSVAEQAVELSQRLPQALADLRTKLSQSRPGSLLLQVIDRGFTPVTGRMLGQAAGILSTVLGAVITIAVILFLGIYLAVTPELYVEGMVMLFPHIYRTRARQILLAVGGTLRWWIMGQALDMVVVGVLTGVGLWLLNIPLALTLGVLAALLNFIPNFGPLISFIPAILLALTISPAQALWVALLYLVVQSLEGYVLLPIIQRRAVRLPEALTITAQVLLAGLVGALGVALAAPLAAAALVVVKMVYIHDVLGDATDAPHSELPPPRISTRR